MSSTILKIAFNSQDTPEKYFKFISMNQYLHYFLPTNFDYKVVSKSEDYDILIYGVQDEEPAEKKNNNNKILNILISVENLGNWSWYKRYNKFGDYGDPNIDIYFYNHTSDIISDNYLSIPTINTYINNYQEHHNDFQTPNPYPFIKKKFLLTINRSSLNKEIKQFIEIIKKQFPDEHIDNIDKYTDEISDKSCYNSPEIINVFNQYKFILCIENSYSNGYITEKIFNCYFANSIPLYKGSPDVMRFLNGGSFVDLRQFNWINILKSINNEESYKEIINKPKINPSYHDDVYKTLLYEKIKNTVFMSKSPKKIITFSLWGKEEFYNYGAYENAIIAKEIYPDWICRFYYSNADEEIIELLRKQNNVELVNMNSANNMSNMFWRFIPAFEEDNVIVMPRDTDSRLNLREKAVVDEWLNSNNDFLIMRDNIHHRTEILGGMWGAKNSILKSLSKEFNSYNRIDKHGNDQVFLKDVVYKNVIGKSSVYDTVGFYRHEKNVLKFKETPYKSFVGSYSRTAPNTFKALGKENRYLIPPDRISKAGVDCFDGTMI